MPEKLNNLTISRRSYVFEPLIYWAIVNVVTDSLIGPKITLLSQKNSQIAVKNSLLVLREFLRDEAVTPYSGGVCPGS